MGLLPQLGWGGELTRQPPVAPREIHTVLSALGAPPGEKYLSLTYCWFCDSGHGTLVFIAVVVLLLLLFIAICVSASSGESTGAGSLAVSLFPADATS